MDQSEIEPEPRRQVPTLVWMVLGVLLVAIFAAVVVMLGRPDPITLPTANPSAQVLQAPPAPEPKATDLSR